MTEGLDELIVTVETAARIVGCTRCGTRAEAQDRMRNDDPVPQEEPLAALADRPVRANRPRRPIPQVDPPPGHPG
ncbi:MAG: hypothetical protein LC808_43280, partial [Actinobacteria bacterium]|nr:hypothetical protein [Actinomycetota bacterium]